MGQSLFNICAPDDHDRLRTYLKCSGAVEADWRKYFTVRLKRAGPRAETPVYEAVKMIGMHRTLDTFCMNSPSSSRELLSPTSSTSSASDTDVRLLFELFRGLLHFWLFVDLGFLCKSLPSWADRWLAAGGGQGRICDSSPVGWQDN